MQNFIANANIYVSHVQQTNGGRYPLLSTEGKHTVEKKGVMKIFFVLNFNLKIKNTVNAAFENTLALVKSTRFPEDSRWG